MSGKRDLLKTLLERRDRLRLEFQTLQTRLDEVEGLLRTLATDSAGPPTVVHKRVRRGDMKDLVLAMVEEAGESGLSSQACVTWAKERRGVELQPASVSSLLSRLKADGILFFDGERYRLKRYAGPRNPAREAV